MKNTLDRIYKAGLKFLEPLTPEQTYATIAEEAVKLVNGSAGSIMLRTNHGLERVYSSDPAIATVKARKKGFAYTAFIKRKALVVHVEEMAKVHPEVSYSGVKSVIFIPLSYRNQSIGVLHVRSPKDDYFSQKELDILKLFGSYASLAIRKTQLYNETKKALETRDLFISMAAHELKTPLTSIHGYIQLLHGKLVGKNTVEARWVERLSWESFRLTQLVKELLEIERIKTGQLVYILKECYLEEVIKRTLENFRLSYPERKIIFSDEIEQGKDMVIGDFDKLLQVLGNIVENAIKFSSADSVVKIFLKVKNTDFIILIKDEGIGIAKKDLKNIFESYYRASSDQSKEGMGLGLYLAKEIIERHHGEINIKSKVNKGTTVEIKLPKAKI